MLLTGTPVAFKTAADRRKLVGCAIKYLRECDMDRSGRGFFFPRVAVVVDVSGRNLFLDNGSVIYAGDLREVVLIDTAELVLR